MSLEWIHENPAYWDDDKRAIVGEAEEGVFAPGSHRAGDVVPGEWWRVEDGGRTVGYGWMDVNWGDAEILLAVAKDARGRGVGTFILDRLEDEARARGLNYLYNAVRPEHPERERTTRWLEERRFRPAEDGVLRRSVAHA